MNQVKFIGICFLLVSAPALALNITVSNPDTEQLGNGKLQCIYENGNDMYQYITTKSQCDYSHTFDTSDAE